MPVLETPGDKKKREDEAAKAKAKAEQKKRDDELIEKTIREEQAKEETPSPAPTPAPKAKGPTESTSAATTGPTAQDVRARSGWGTAQEAQQARARDEAVAATSVGTAQERYAGQGAFGGLSLSDRARAERMVRNGEAKTREEAAQKIRDEKKPPKPPAVKQADALEPKK